LERLERGRCTLPRYFWRPVESHASGPVTGAWIKWDVTMAQRPQKAPDKDTVEEDRVLLSACFEHRRDAWDRFVERFTRLVYSVVHETLRRHGARTDDDEVDDLFHTVFLALYDHNYRKLRQWNSGCSLASWIRFVAMSVVVDALRRRRPTVSLDADTGKGEGTVADRLETPQASSMETLELAERAVAVRRALAALPAPDRELLELLFDDELAPGSVAERLEIRPGALYTRKNRALARLRDLIVGQTPEFFDLGSGEVTASRSSRGRTGANEATRVPQGRPE